MLQINISRYLLKNVFCQQFLEGQDGAVEKEEGPANDYTDDAEDLVS